MCKSLISKKNQTCSVKVGLGVLLTMVVGTDMKGDELLPTFVHGLTQGLPLQSSVHGAAQGMPLQFVPYLFILGIVAASFSSADSALTSLTTCYCVDICRRPHDERLRKKTHLIVCAFFVLFILLFRYTSSTSLIDAIYILVSYTYGPLLGLFAFGLFTRRKPNDRIVPFICVSSPIACYALDAISQHLWNYRFGYELLMVNGLLTFIGLCLSSSSSDRTQRM